MSLLAGDAGESWADGKKMQHLMSAGRDLELAFSHTAADLHDLADKCQAEQVSQLVSVSFLRC